MPRDMRPGLRAWVLGPLLAALLGVALAARAAEGGPAPAVEESDPAAGIASAPVVVDGHVLFGVRGVTGFPAQRRADEIAGRIVALAEDRAVAPASVRVTEESGVVFVRTDRVRVLAVLEADARMEAVSVRELATARAIAVRDAIEAWRAARAPRALAAGVLWALGATLALAVGIVLALRVGRRLEDLVERRLAARVRSVGIQSFEIVRAQRIREGVTGLVRVARFALVLLLLLAYLPFVLGLFPWTRPFAERLLELVTAPVLELFGAFLRQIPNLVFLAILYVVVRFAVRVVRLFFEAIERGTVTLAGFDPEWAIPTYKIVRFVAVAFALVVAYPYIPGSGSDAFKGVTVFLGLVLSLGSTSTISQAIAGYTMIYRRAFRVGDRIRVGKVTGDVVASRLMVTQVRTVKNEMVVIPNSTILNSEVVNYSALAREQGLILHTTVGIGYETPWRQVEAMLLLAAARTPGLRADPPPFVHHTALGDFCVTYEINAYCDDASAMARLYTELHRRILDVFNEYGVQIMTPAYEGDPAEPKVVPKANWHLAPADAPPGSPSG